MKNTMFTCLWRVETRKKVMYYTMEWCCAYVASNNNIPPADITESHWKPHIVKRKSMLTVHGGLLGQLCSTSGPGVVCPPVSRA